MKKFMIILSVLAMVTFIAMPAFAWTGSNFKINGNADQTNGGTIMSGDVTVHNNGRVTVGGGRVLGHLYHRWTPILRGNWNGSYAVGITAGGSFAYKDCNGFTKVAGSGNISHGTYATNRRGSFAYTSGNSAYSYNGRTHDDSIVGGGVAVTGGYSGISTSGTTTSLFAVSGSTAATGVTRSVFNFPSCGGCY